MNADYVPPYKKMKQSQLKFMRPTKENIISSSLSLPTLSTTSAVCAQSITSSATYQSVEAPDTSKSIVSPDSYQAIAVTTSGSSGSSSGSSSSSSSIASVQYFPNHPSISFKKDRNNRRFQEDWFKRWSWLDWNFASESVLCFPCRMVSNQLDEHLFSKCNETAFVQTGFSNWKDATRCFKKHEGSSCHAESVNRWCAYIKGINVASQISSHHTENQKLSQAMLLKILSTVRYLSRQGLAFRGHTYDSGNFRLLLQLRCEDDPNLVKWMDQKKSFLSHDIQNEYIGLMSNHVSRRLLERIQKARFYSIIADEVTDQTSQHQLGISIRWVDEQFHVHEDFLALSLLPSGDAKTITHLIKDFLTRSSLLIENCRGQCYDGASVMAGHVTGVSKRIVEEEPRAVFVHCLAHSLNLALQESARQWPIYRDMMDYLKDVINLICASPKRAAVFVDLQSQSPELSLSSLRPLCPTRWTTREQSIHSVLMNYSVVEETLQVIAETDMSDAGTKANGLLHIMKTFSFYFALRTGMIVFQRTELLSRLLQSSTISVPEALKAAEQTRANLQFYREEGSWQEMWTSFQRDAARLNLDPPTVPRLRRPPRRLDEGALPCTQTAEQYYRMIFYQFLDNILETMNSRIQQPSLELYAKVEDVILRSANNRRTSDTDESITTICTHFRGDLDPRLLRLNLDMLAQLMEGKMAEKLSDVTDKLEELGAARRLYSEVSKLIVLLLVIPASSATAERSFSCLRRLKTYLRSTMGQERLNHFLILNVHQDETDLIDLKSVARDFVSLNDVRRNTFGYL